MIKTNFVYLVSLFSLLDLTQCDNELNYIHNEYVYQDYYSLDRDSCIVSNNRTGNRPTIQFCDGKYKVSNHSLILPRNTLPICAYFPEWYDLEPESYYQYIEDKSLKSNITYNKSMKECAAELPNFSKSRFKDMYKKDTHGLMCIRVSEYKANRYREDPKIIKLRKKIESLIQDKVKWKNTKFQADLIMSSFCSDTNK
jgi:hypothetical protein